jgi:hypothetical protein
MSVTSGWMFDEIDRGYDISVSGGLTLRRNVWSISRHRISDDTYSSQLGEIAASLSGANGGVTETVQAPSRTVVSFDTSQNWIETTDRFVEAGFEHNSRPVYVMEYGQRSKYNASRTVVLAAIPLSAGGTSLFWYAYQSSPLSISQQDVPAFAGLATGEPFYQRPYAKNTAGFTANSITSLTPHGLSITGTIVYSGASTATVASEQGDFLCISDRQSYPEKYIDYFTQTQTWTYKDQWVIV